MALLSEGHRLGLIRTFVVAECCRILALVLSRMRQELALRWGNWVLERRRDALFIFVAKCLGGADESGCKKAEFYLQASWRPMNCATLEILRCFPKVNSEYVGLLFLNSTGPGRPFPEQRNLKLHQPHPDTIMNKDASRPY